MTNIQRLFDREILQDGWQKEGWTHFEQCTYGGTMDVSQTYHHVKMHETAQPYLGFAWDGVFYRFIVLPFGISLRHQGFSPW